MPTILSSRERLERVMRGQPVDRVPIRLWGVDPLESVPRPEWRPLHALVNDFHLDTFFDWGGDWPPSPVEVREETREVGNPEWYEQITTFLTPAGELSRVFLHSRAGKPGYIKKYLIESGEDACRWLSIPPRGLPNTDSFADAVARAGERGMVLASLGEAMYAANDGIGSELWGLWMYDERELVDAMVAKASDELAAVARHLLANGVGPLFGWVGPELCIPPLASPRDFDDFVTRYDKRIIDLVHDAGGLVWVHCHGDMHPVLERFADMGVDCLNPMEPPPAGRLTLADAKRRVGARMALEGGFEVGDLELGDADAVAATVREVMAMGKPGGRFILCPSSSHTHWPDMSEHIANNYRVFVETAISLADY